MAGPLQPPQRSGRPSILRWVIIALVALIVLVGLIILIVWLTIRPKRLIYSVESASVQNFELTKTQLMNASFNLEVRAYNPNKRVSIYYDYVTVTVGFGDQDLAFGVIKPFYQSRKNVTLLNVKLVDQNFPLHDSVSKDLALQKAAGEMDLDFWIKARIRFKVGAWKSGHRTLRVKCSPVIVYLSRAKDFKKASCFTEVD